LCERTCNSTLRIIHLLCIKNLAKYYRKKVEMQYLFCVNIIFGTKGDRFLNA